MLFNISLDFKSLSSALKRQPCDPHPQANYYMQYCEVPKFSDARKFFCNLPKTQTKRPNLRVFRQKDANGIANSEDPDQTAPLVAV